MLLLLVSLATASSIGGDFAKCNLNDSVYSCTPIETDVIINRRCKEADMFVIRDYSAGQELRDIQGTVANAYAMYLTYVHASKFTQLEDSVNNLKAKLVWYQATYTNISAMDQSTHDEFMKTYYGYEDAVGDLDKLKKIVTGYTDAVGQLSQEETNLVNKHVKSGKFMLCGE